MLEHAGELSAAVLHLGHHDSLTSTDPAFLEAADPEAAAYSAGKDNSYGHPHPEVISLVNGFGIDLYGTGTHGTIVVTAEGNSYTIETHEEGPSAWKVWMVRFFRKSI
jgi:beta-lactamase superfamily II metal-dependent hydrolase